MEDAAGVFARAGFDIVKTGSARGYQGAMPQLPGVDIVYVGE